MGERMIEFDYDIRVGSGVVYEAIIFDVRFQVRYAVGVRVEGYVTSLPFTRVVYERVNG